MFNSITDLGVKAQEGTATINVSANQNQAVEQASIV